MEILGGDKAAIALPFIFRTAASVREIVASLNLR
jgi:hypothetical protein